MAVLKQPSAGSRNPFAEQCGDQLPPVGTWVATVLDINDTFGVVRSKYENPSETETVDLATFLFGFRDESGAPHKIASKSMKISGNEKSALYGFLKSILGAAPAYGEDYCQHKGKQCLITVEHVTKRDGSGVFAAISSLSPVPKGMTAPAAPAPAPKAAAPAARTAPAVKPAPKAAVAEDPIPF
jgi:hypothetical protein